MLDSESKVQRQKYQFLVDVNKQIAKQHDEQSGERISYARDSVRDIHVVLPTVFCEYLGN